MQPVHDMYLLCFSRYTVVSVITPTGRSSYNQQSYTIGIIPISVLSSDILCCSDPYFCVTYDFFWVHSSPLQYRNVFAGHNSIRRLLYVHSFVPLACAECDDTLLFSGASSIPLLCTFSCYPSPPTIRPSSLTSSCYLFLGLPLSLVPKFVYNTLLGILYSSILSMCPNQRNLFNLIVSIIVGFLTLA